MKTQHTPGPWEYNWFKVGAEADCGICTKDGISICRAPHYVTKEQWETDAKFITGAHDMAEALKLLVDEFGYTWPQEYKDKARAALAKAGVE
jgi:hypothetical protein